MIWNQYHGSEKEPGFQPGAGCPLAAFYNKKGFVFFLPHRHGHGLSPGEYIVDINNRLTAFSVKNEEEARLEMVKLHAVYNRDVAAAVAWLKSQPFVDKNRVVMSGVSYGGIQTLVSAENIPGIRGFISFAPAAMSWKIPTSLRERMLTAIHNAKAPIFCYPGRQRLQHRSGAKCWDPRSAKGAGCAEPGQKLYPAFGADDDHRKGHAAFSTWNIGIDIWSPDVMHFVGDVLHKN